VGDKDNFKKKVLVDEATGDGFALSWETIAEPEMKAFPYFRE